MTSDLLERVRAACEEVSRRARHVHIDADKIPAYAASLPVEKVTAPQLDPRDQYAGSDEGVVAFVLTLDAVNFGSGYFPHLLKRGDTSGYFTIASALRERFESEGPFTAEELRGLTPRACASLFGQDLNDEARAELMGLFASALNDLGRYLQDRFGGRFTGPVEEAKFSAARLVGILAEMPYFRDVSRYEGLEVPFYKRAQITAADLWVRFGGRRAGFFDDINRLTMFADNAVPNVLRVDGVLSYESALAERIIRGELIPAGADEEIEIRASALHAVELIVGALRDAGHDVTPMTLDSFLWTRGQHPRYKASPRHRTRTVFY